MRKFADEQDARACIRAAKAAGQSLGAWSRRHGVDGRSLHAWGLSLRRRGPAGRTRSKLRLVEMIPTSVAPMARYTVRVGGSAIEFGDDFRDETVARVVRVLQAC